MPAHGVCAHANAGTSKVKARTAIFIDPFVSIAFGNERPSALLSRSGKARSAHGLAGWLAKGRAATDQCERSCRPAIRNTGTEASWMTIENAIRAAREFSYSR